MTAAEIRCARSRTEPRLSDQYAVFRVIAPASDAAPAISAHQAPPSLLLSREHIRQGANPLSSDHSQARLSQPSLGPVDGEFRSLAAGDTRPDYSEQFHHQFQDSQESPPSFHMTYHERMYSAHRQTIPGHSPSFSDRHALGSTSGVHFASASGATAPWLGNPNSGIGIPPGDSLAPGRRGPLTTQRRALGQRSRRSSHVCDTCGYTASQSSDLKVSCFFHCTCVFSGIVLVSKRTFVLYSSIFELPKELMHRKACCENHGYYLFEFYVFPSRRNWRW